MRTETRRCQHCGTAFTARVVATEPRRGRFCGLACFHAANTKYPRPERPCDSCGARFVPDKSQARALATGDQTLAFCSPACWRASLPAKYAREANPHWQGGRIESRRYQYVRQDRHPVSHYVAVHRAVAEAMLGRRLLATEVVHHRDGDEGNNDPSNLQVLTRGEHRRLHTQLDPMVGEQHPNAKLTWAKARAIRARATESQAVLAAEMGVSQTTISLIRRGMAWKEQTP
jgi:DNA-binding XRE family transcriptional regulator